MNAEWWRGYLDWGENEETHPSCGYFVVYNSQGQQCGHVWIDDVHAAKQENPALRYEPSRVAARAAAQADEREAQR